jgi:hypothetical protein
MDEMMQTLFESWKFDVSTGSEGSSNRVESREKVCPQGFTRQSRAGHKGIDIEDERGEE